jgi:hypothetical protein
LRLSVVTQLILWHLLELIIKVHISCKLSRLRGLRAWWHSTIIVELLLILLSKASIELSLRNLTIHSEVWISNSLIKLICELIILDNTHWVHLSHMRASTVNRVKAILWLIKLGVHGRLLMLLILVL